MQDSDSTTAIGQASAEDSWLETGDEHQLDGAKGGIRRTIELDVISRTKRSSRDYENFSQEAVGGFVV